jgi:hypothetical protein
VTTTESAFAFIYGQGPVFAAQLKSPELSFLLAKTFF